MPQHRPRTPPPSLDAALLERLALRYVERFATTRGKLTDYLSRKIRERGWDGGESPDPAAIAARMADLGYIDDRAYGEAKAAAMARRGLGETRVVGLLRQARLGPDDLEAVALDVPARAREAAITYARRRRIGPFASVPADRPSAQRQLAAMVRAGHPFGLARAIVGLEPGAELPDEDPDRFGHCEADQSC